MRKGAVLGEGVQKECTLCEEGVSVCGLEGVRRAWKGAHCWFDRFGCHAGVKVCSRSALFVSDT
jgi:hypothetical protein